MKFSVQQCISIKNERALRNGIGIYIVTSAKLVFVGIMLIYNLHECSSLCIGMNRLVGIVSHAIAHLLIAAKV